jgi:hypothetical protein
MSDRKVPVLQLEIEWFHCLMSSIFQPVSSTLTNFALYKCMEFGTNSLFQKISILPIVYNFEPKLDACGWLLKLRTDIK